MANNHRDPDASPKLSDVWSFVLLRGLFEGALLTAVFFGAFYRVGPLALLIGSTLLGGSLVELAMAHQLRGHPFRSILIFTGVTGLMIAGLILYNYQFAEAQVTLNLLVVMMGLWVAARGFAALWLGLSIVTGGFDRAVPVGAGLVGLSAGFAALMFFSPEEPTWFVRAFALRSGLAGRASAAGPPHEARPPPPGTRALATATGATGNARRNLARRLTSLLRPACSFVVMRAVALTLPASR